MKNLTLQKSGHTAILSINRPEVLNSLNFNVLEELKQFFEITIIEEQIRAVILTGSGDKAFIAGADVKEMSTMDHATMIQFIQLGQHVANLIETSPALVIAAVNGYALGGGLEMALASDFIYSSQNAKFGLPEVLLGLIPGFGGTQRLSQAIGSRKAKELTLSGKIVPAEEAKELGLVNEIYSSDQLLNACVDFAKTICTLSSTAIINAKKAINGGMTPKMDSGLELERNLFSACFETEESKKAINAFLLK